MNLDEVAKNKPYFSITQIIKFGLPILVALELPLLWAGHTIAPTNLAGPGLDFWVLILSALLNIYMIIWAVKNWKRGRFAKLCLLAAGMSSLLILYFLNTN